MKIECERMGVSEKWPKLKGVIGRIKKFDWNGDFDIKNITQYATRNDLSGKLPNTSNVTHSSGMDCLGRHMTEELLVDALQGKPWLEGLAQWNRYYEVGFKQDFFGTISLSLPKK